MGGKTFTIMTNGWWNYAPLNITDICAEDVNGESMNDAVYERMSAINEKYNVNLEVADYPKHSDGITALNTTAAAGDDAYQIAIVRSYNYGALLSGDVTVRDIGIPVELARETLCPAQTVETDFLRAVLPKRKPDGHKGTFGKLLIVGGCVGYTGAPYLSAMAACRSGCGMVYLGVPETVWAVEAVKCTEAMPFPSARGTAECT